MVKRRRYKIRWNWRLPIKAVGVVFALIWGIGFYIAFLVAGANAARVPEHWPKHKIYDASIFHHLPSTIIFSLWLGPFVLAGMTVGLVQLYKHPPFSIERVDYVKVKRSRLKELESRSAELEKEAGL